MQTMGRMPLDPVLYVVEIPKGIDVQDAAGLDDGQKNAGGGGALTLHARGPDTSTLDGLGNVVCDWRIVTTDADGNESLVLGTEDAYISGSPSATVQLIGKHPAHVTVRAIPTDGTSQSDDATILVVGPDRIVYRVHTDDGGGEFKELPADSSPPSLFVAVDTTLDLELIPDPPPSPGFVWPRGMPVWSTSGSSVSLSGSGDTVQATVTATGTADVSACCGTTASPPPPSGGIGITYASTAAEEVKTKVRVKSARLDKLHVQDATAATRTAEDTDDADNPPAPGNTLVLTPDADGHATFSARAVWEPSGDPGPNNIPGEDVLWTLVPYNDAGTNACSPTSGDFSTSPVNFTWTAAAGAARWYRLDAVFDTDNVVIDAGKNTAAFRKTVYIVIVSADLRAAAPYLQVNDDHDEGKTAADDADPSPVNAARTAIVTNDMIRLYPTLTPWDDAVLDGATVTLTASDSSVVRVLAVSPNAKAPFAENVAWTVVPFNTDLATDFFRKKANGAGKYRGFVWGVEGLKPGETTLTLTYVRDGLTVASSELPLVVLGIRWIPLGDSAQLSKYIIGKVYVPTRWGGELGFTGGNVDLYYDRGLVWSLPAVYRIYLGTAPAQYKLTPEGGKYILDPNEHKFGWFYVRVASTQNVGASFEQHRAATTRPWDFYFWPTDPTGQYHLCKDIPSEMWDGDDGGAVGKYDRLKTRNALQIIKNDSKEYSTSGEGWYGHCGGASFASIVLKQPEPKADPQGRGEKYELTEDELEGLYAFLFREGNGWDVEWAWGKGVYPLSYSEVDHNGKYTNGEALIKPKPGWETSPFTLGSPDYFAARCHAMIEQHIGLSHPAHVAAQGALIVDFRTAKAGGKPDEEWHHAIYKYDATYVQKNKLAIPAFL